MPNRPVRECIKRDEALVGKAEDTVQQAAKRMAEACCSSILICDGDRLRGIFTERDLLVRVVAAGLDPSTTPLGQVMTADPDTIEGSAPVIEAIRRMDEFSYRHMPVVERGPGDRRDLLARPALRGALAHAARARPAAHAGRADVVAAPAAAQPAPVRMASTSSCSRTPVDRQAPCCGVPVKPLT